MKAVNAIAILSSVAVVAMGQPHRFLRSMMNEREPSEHLFPLILRHLREESAADQRALFGSFLDTGSSLLGPLEDVNMTSVLDTVLDANLTLGDFFPGGGGEDIYNLPNDVDTQFRLFVLVYDVALFPYWMPLIKAGETNGAGYDDLFRCVLDPAPFVPCLYENKLISPEQWNCYRTDGLTTECILLGNPFTDKLQGAAAADELTNETEPVPPTPGNRPRMLWSEIVGYEFDRLLNDKEVWRNQLVKYNPHDALAELGFDRSLQQVSEDFFTGADVDNLPKEQDFLVRLLILTYDVALAPIWLPLIKIGGTGGATYQDLFFCVLDQGPFIPCLFDRGLISPENYDCYQDNGLTWKCILQGNILFQKFGGGMDQVSAELFNETSTDVDGNSTRKLFSERTLHITSMLTEALQEFTGSETYGRDNDSQWLPDLVSCLVGPPPYDKCVLGESIHN